MQKITVVKVNNPFNSGDREIQKVEYSGKSIIKYVPRINDNEFSVSIDGALVPYEKWETVPVKAGSYIAIIPKIGKGGKGKEIVGLIAGIALSIVSMGVGSVISGGAFFGKHALAMASWSWGGYLAALAVMYVGGLLISKMQPKPQLDLEQQVTTYSWSPQAMAVGQGYPLGILYGTAKPTPILLAQHVTSDGENQYLNMLLCLGEGPIDSIDNIKINDNPIENYENVVVEKRLGTNNQTVISNFNDTFADQPLMYELIWGGAPTIHQTDTNAANGLEIELIFPNGLFHINDDGGYSNASVTVTAEYALIDPISGVRGPFKSFFTDKLRIESLMKNNQALSGPDALYNIALGPNAGAETWRIVCTETHYRDGYNYPKKFSVSGSVSGAQVNAAVGSRYANGFIIFDISTSYPMNQGEYFDFYVSNYTEKVISASSSSQLRRTFRADNVTVGKYDVKLTCVSKSGDTARDNTRVYWSQLSSIIYDDFTRPGKVLLSIKALATGKLSGGTPTISCTITRRNVYVWNPATNAYEAKPADNPAWGSYDHIHRAKPIFDIRDNTTKYTCCGAAKEKLIYQDFANWAVFCDEHDLKINYFVGKTADLWTSLKEFENCGRGKVVVKGTRFSCICDKPGTPVQLFTMGNIIKDTFREEFIAMRDRANALEITFNNAEKNYERDVVVVYADDYDADNRVKNPTQVTFDGIIFFAQAFREAKYRLRLNKYLTRTVSFETSVEAIACRIGDIILVQHDVPQWGFGGRIINVTGNDTIILDRTIELKANITYSIIIRLSNDVIVTRTIPLTDHDGQTDTVTVTTPFDAELMPTQHDVYSFGELNIVAKPFRVVNITRSIEQRRRITALEYIDAIYQESENIPVIQYSQLNPYYEVLNLTVGQETFIQRDGTAMSVLYVNWKGPSKQKALIYKIFYSRDGGQNWIEKGGGLATSDVIYNVKPLTTYLVKVCILNEYGILTPGAISQPVYVTGKNMPPDNVANFTATADPNDKTRIMLSWDAVSNYLDLRGYEIKESGVTVAAIITDTKYVFKASMSKTYNFSIRAVDTSGNYSVVASTAASVIVSVEPSDVTGFTAAANANDRTKVNLSWNALQEIDIANYEIRLGDTWESGTVIAHLKTASYTYQLTEAGFKRFWMKAVNLGGFYSIDAAGASGQFNFISATPAGGQVTQDLNDRTRLLVSWLPVADPDVIQYEVRLGNVWDTGQVVGIVNGTSIVHIISANGAYNFMVRSKNVAGYYSTILNISGEFLVSVSNVQNFTGTRAAHDKGKIRLTWSAVPDRDVDHYEIREGATWDGGTLVFGNISGTFYDATTTTEKTYKYWIKAISKSCHESAIPTLFEILISMNPTAPSNFTITTDLADRTKALMMWDASPDLDVIEYEIRNGIDWQSGETIVKTKELRFVWSLPESETYNLRLRARNASDFESDEVIVPYTSYIEPSDVTGFKALQNGENVLLIWNKVTDVDHASCEIREGPTWEMGSTLTTGLTGVAFQFLADRETSRTFWIKAVNRAGKRSQNAVSSTVVISGLQPRNVIVSYDEIAEQDGTKDRTDFGPSEFRYSAFSGKFNEYTTTRFSEVGGASVLRLARIPWTWQNLPGLWSDYPEMTFDALGNFNAAGEYITTVKDVGRIMSANISVVFTSSTAMTPGTSAGLYYRTSSDGVNWIEWQPYITTQMIFRYIQFKAVLASIYIDKTPEVNHFTINIDVPDVIKNGAYNVAIGGSSINYGYDYYAVPSVVPTATTLGHRATLNGAPDDSSFGVKVYDANNNDVGGPILWIARGY